MQVIGYPNMISEHFIFSTVLDFGLVRRTYVSLSQPRYPTNLRKWREKGSFDRTCVLSVFVGTTLRHRTWLSIPLLLGNEKHHFVSLLWILWSWLQSRCRVNWMHGCSLLVRRLAVLGSLAWCTVYSPWIDWPAALWNALHYTTLLEFWT